MIHVVNGDSVGNTLNQSNIRGTVLAYADVLHDGPVPADVDDEQLRDTRVRFIASRDWGAYEDVLHRFRDWDVTLARFRDHEEVVLWFEHDLFDQLLLIRHLDWFARRDLGSTRLSLICIDAFPGVLPFHGLGQLTAGQLSSLLPTRRPVTHEQLALGRRAWAAFRSSDPRDVERLLATDTTPLPFLAGALVRYLQEFPGTADGLPRTEREVLGLLSNGALSPDALFRAEQGREERVYMGDASFWWRIEALAAPPRPLVTLNVQSRKDRLPEGELMLTDIGCDVLAGRADWIAVAGIDRWLGGVHLKTPPSRTPFVECFGEAGPGRIWRWDATSRCLRATAPGEPR